MNMIQTFYKKGMVLLAGLFCMTLAFSQENLSMTDAIVKGLRNNYGIQIAKATEVIANRNNNWGTAGRFPRLDFTATGSLFENPNSFATSGRSLNFGPALSWVLFDGFSIYANKDRLETLARQSGLNTAVIVENNIEAIMLAYNQALVTQEQVNVLRATLEASTERLEYEELRKELGTSGTFQTLQFQNAVIADSSALLQQQLFLKNTFRNLNLVMGEEPETEYILTDNLQETFGLYQYEDLYQKMISQNQNLKNQMVNLELAQIDTRLAKAALYPTVSLGGNGTFTAAITDLISGDQISSMGVNFQYSANVTLSYNLFNGGNTRRAIQNAKVTENINRLSIKDLQNTLSHQLRSEWDNFAIRKQLLGLQNENIEVTQENLDLAEERFKTGLLSSLDYRDIQILYRNAQFARIQAIQSLLVSEIALMRLTGTLLNEYGQE